MPFSNSPQFSTYKTEKIEFIEESNMRSSNNSVRRDAHIINFYFDRVSNENQRREVALKKRPGLANTSVFLQKGVSTISLKGYYYDETYDASYWAVNNDIYRSVTGGVPVLITTISGESFTQVYFQPFIKAATEVKYIVFCNGTSLRGVPANPATSAAITTATGLPAGHNPQFVVFDGYAFVSQNSTIYNSNLDDVFTFNFASGFIDAEMSADPIKILFQNKNYVVAMGSASMEIFYDPGNNPAPGSPLSVQTSGFKSIGYISGYANVGDFHFFVGQERNSNPAVYKIEDFKFKQVSTPVVERTIEAFAPASQGLSRAFLANGHSISADGHRFYVLCTSEITWAYDIDEDMWYEWRTVGDVPLTIEAAWSKYNGGQYVAVKNQSTIDYFSSLVYNDYNNNYICSYTTNDNLFNTVNWKTCNRVALIGDRHATTGTSFVTLQWSDNDWGDGVTGSVQLNVFSNLPKAHRLGRFRNRSFRLLYADNYPIRIKSLELELNVGAH